MSEKRLMVLGSLGEFVRLVKLARSQGIYTVVCDGYEGSPAKAEADASYVCDVRNVDGIVEICKKERVNGIITSFSDLLFEQMVKIADKAGLPCYAKPEMLPYYRDKMVAKELFDRLGIATAKHKQLSADFSDQDLDGFQFPLVAKPVNGYGSKGIYVIHDIGQLRDVFEEITRYSDIKDVLVEEYYDSHEYNVMAWLVDGKVYILSVGDRDRTVIDKNRIPVLSRVAYPSCFADQICEEARDILQKFADAVGQREGSLSMQCFWKKGEPIHVCEIAGRMLGYEHELITYASGFDVEQMLLNYVYDKAALADMLKAHSPFFTKYYAGIYYIGEERMIRDQKTIREIGEWENVIEHVIFFEEGERVDFSGPNPYVVRYYIRGDSREKLDALTEKIYQTAKVYDDEGKNLLFRYQLED